MKRLNCFWLLYRRLKQLLNSVPYTTYSVFYDIGKHILGIGWTFGGSWLEAIKAISYVIDNGRNDQFWNGFLFVEQ